MNPVQEVAVKLLNDLKANQTKINSFLAGEFSSTNMKTVIADIEKVLEFLKPLLNDIDALIPASMPELKLVLDWAVKIINQIEPN
jgi:pantothenate kinase-related protein Tda10